VTNFYLARQQPKSRKKLSAIHYLTASSIISGHGQFLDVTRVMLFRFVPLEEVARWLLFSAECTIGMALGIGVAKAQRQYGNEV